MKRRNALCVAVVVAVVVSVACGGGGGGGGNSPTGPTIVQVAGTWEGTWVTASGLVSVPTRLVLSQVGTQVTGTVTVIVTSTFVFDLVGEVNGSFFSWEVPDAGCTTFEGKGFDARGNPNPTSMKGNMVLDGRACGDRKFGGPITIDKVSSTTSSSLSGPPVRTDMSGLRDELRER